MADQDKHQQRPSRSPPSLCTLDRKRRDPDPPGKDAKRRKSTSESCRGQPRDETVPAPSVVAGPSGVNTSSPELSSKDDKLEKLNALLVGLIDKLDKGHQHDVSVDSVADFSGFHDFSSSEGEAGDLPDKTTDPLDDLDKFCPAPEEDNADFLRALEDLSGHFHGEEEKGEPLSDRLATILDASLRRRPSADSVKQTCSKIKLPSNVPNLAVPVTNSAITKAMSVGGRLVDSRLSHTNGLVCKALVPIVQCINDIGEKSSKPLASYLEGLNISVRLMTSVINYINHLRKEVARLHVHDRALVDLCKWECEVGRAELFPFDVVKKCDEIRRTGKLGRPVYRPFSSANRRHSSQRQAPRRHPSWQQQGRQRSQTKPFLGQRPPLGRGSHKYNTLQ